MNNTIRLVSVLIMALLADQSALAKKKDNEHTPTLKDLQGKTEDVTPQPASTATQEQAADAYRHFLELQNPNPKLRAEAMRRLGDLNVEVNEGSQAADPEKMDTKTLKESIELYENLLKNYPNYPNSDAVLYQLSRAYEATGDSVKALATLDRMVARFPASRWYVEAQFRRGELLFSGKKYTEAAKAYTAVVNGGMTSGFYDQGLYKQAWSFFKLGRSDESAEAFLKLLDRVLIRKGTLRTAKSLTRPERELSTDALHTVAVLAFDEDGPNSINALFNKRGDPAYGYMLYASLGDLYLEKERYQDAAQAFTAFSVRHPDARQAPTLQSRAIEAYQKGGFAARVLEAKQEFVERYAFTAPFWATRKREDAPEVVTEIKSHLKDLAQYYHAQAGKTKKPEDYTAAAHWYRSLLDSFPDDSNSPNTRYLLGELLFDAGRFAEATQEYEYTAYNYPQHAKSAAAGYAALVSYQKLEPTLSGEAKATWHRKFIDSSVMYATSFPNEPQAPQVLTKAAEDLFALNEFDRTIEVARQLLDRNPPADAKLRRSATTLMAHSLYDRARYAEAEQAYLQARTFLAANDPDMGAINDRIAASIYKQAEAKQAAGDSNSAVNDFLRVVALTPNSKIAANAQFDAATALINQNNWPRAIEVLEQFRRSNPNHELAPEVTKKLAVGYQQTGRSLDAAAEYERIAARREETAEIRRSALWQAAELYNAAAKKGQASAITLAANDYAAYIVQFPQQFDLCIEARQNLVDLAVLAHDNTARNRWLNDIIQADRNAGTARTPRSKFLAARAFMITMQPQVEAFNSIRLTQPLKNSIKQKRAAMDAVLKTYGQALDYNVAEVTTEATYGMAELYRKMAQDMTDSERPKKLDADSLEQYNVMLEEQTIPFEDKSIALHQANVQHARDGVYDEWVKKSYAALAKLMPARYSKTEVSEDYVTHLQ
ncbi:MAG: tetratricopeptide repeat protein [Steroidobacter sp.]